MSMRYLRRVTKFGAIVLALGLLAGCEDDADENGDLDATIDIEEDVGQMQPDAVEPADAQADATTVDAAGEEDADAQAGDADAGGPSARLQFIHASPDPNATPVDVYINDELALDDFEYLTATEMMAVTAETDLNVEVAPGDSTSAEQAVYSQTITLEPDTRMVAVASGVLNPENFQGSNNAFEFRAGEAAESVGVDNVALNIFHGSTDAASELGGPIDIATVGGTTLADDLMFGNFTGVQELPANNYTLQVQTSDNAQTAASFQADLSGAAGQYLTVVAAGFVTLEAPDPTDGEPFGLVAFDKAGNAMALSAAN